ncbi:MAG: Stp1/IreP family PP2C-type Ser/Thr phosphatase [Clostridia bacterium]|nr:Stp1/IreP family PP2C-type Ser/Thr phosphatase [Clostridia bacterium]
MKIVGKTDVGSFRQRNEDAFAFGYYDDGAAWALVCDGMGGVHGGQIASSTAIELISDKIKKCYIKTMPVSSFENLLLSSVTTANVTVYDRGSVDMNLRGMGTTVVAAVYKDNEACIAHVGDSRAYKISGDSVELITKDHSLVQEMLDNGQITAEEYENAPIKNIITRALGISEEVDIDFDFVCINPGELLLLCSDGFSGYVTEKEILEIYKNSDFDCLADEYIVRANENGSRDNITVVVMKG